MTSLKSMRELSGSQDGFGGDLGGLEGADKICQDIATGVGAGSKTWKAFLSVVQGPDGNPVNAIDRVGDGPWYDRNKRLLAQNRAGLQNQRPAGNSQIINDLPDENGEGLKQLGDTHDILTGSNDRGELDTNDKKSTCLDWTSTDGKNRARAGHSWPSGRSPGWIRAHNVPGCAAGVNLRQDGNGSGTDIVGGAGGYGGIYCFALTP
ncbi:MAG: hypothetical protein GY847_36740 [Proteobacteria bacterium]|nr:hypothetical protein [Pseudomonadota bacterium]